MRLSTEPDRDEARAVATLHAALDAGVTLIDTADAYCWDARETGHDERLVARALAAGGGAAARVRVATKGGLIDYVYCPHGDSERPEAPYTTAGSSGVPVHFVIPSAPASVMKMTSSWRMPISPGM